MDAMQYKSEDLLDKQHESKKGKGKENANADLHQSEQCEQAMDEKRAWTLSLFGHV